MLKIIKMYMVIVKLYKKFINKIKNINLFFILLFFFIFRSLINKDIFVILKWPFIFYFNWFEFKLIKQKKKKKLKKLLLNYNKYYKILLNYNSLPKLNSKYLFINFYKLKIKFYIIQTYYIIVNFYKLNFEFIKNSRKKRKFFGFLNFDFFSNSNIHFISKKKYIKTHFIILYMEFLKKKYFNTYYIKYRISWFENRLREQRNMFWDRVEIKKEKFKSPFLDFYSFLVSDILHISSYMPFNFINFFVFILILLNYKFIKYIYNTYILKLIFKYEHYIFLYEKKKKRFMKYTFKSFFKGVICITYNKLYKEDEEEQDLEDFDYYVDNIKFTKLGKIFGYIYNSLGLWSGINKGIWKGFKK